MSRHFFTSTVLLGLFLSLPLLADDHAEHGIDFSALYIGEYTANVSGGIKKQGFYLANLDLKANFNLEKLTHLKRTRLFLYGLGLYGKDPSTAIGDLQLTSNIEGPNTSKVYELYLEHSLFDDSLKILLGLFDLNSEFYLTQSSVLFLHSSFGIGAELAQTGLNGPSIFPTTHPAVRISYQVSPEFTLRGAAFEDRGTLSVGEIAYTTPPTTLTLGGWFYSRTFEEITQIESSDQEKQEDSLGLYFLAEKEFSSQLTAFLRYGLAANNEAQRPSSNLSLGVNYLGPLPGRSNDIFGFGYTQAFTKSDSEAVLEFTYRYQYKENYALQPDLQYVINPGGSGSEIDNALVISLRLEIAL